MKLVLMDFDGTLTHQDSLAHFIQFAVGKKKYYWGLLLLSPVLILYLTQLIANHRAKQILFSYFLKNYPFEKFDKVAKNYSKHQLPTIIKKQAQERIDYHKEQGHKIVIVSASIENWLEDWSQANGFDLIATQIEVQNNQLTGQFKSKNCYGQEKVYRIQQAYDLKSFDLIYAYGDSKGDLPMLNLAHQKFYKPFKL